LYILGACASTLPKNTIPAATTSRPKNIVQWEDIATSILAIDHFVINFDLRIATKAL
jgi:hypothetical protein